MHGPKKNLHRPSIDALFRSAARWAGPRTIGVVLTGARDDGKVGMRAVKQRGGLTIVQDPHEAPFPSMPLSVMQEIEVDYSMPLREIGPLLNQLSHESTEEEGSYPVAKELEIESRIAEQKMEAEELIASVERIGKISKLTCPDCHGALWEMNDENMLRYRCHVGHAFSAEALTEGQSEMLEVALWSAVRALEEQMMLARRIVERARKASRQQARAHQRRSCTSRRRSQREAKAVGRYVIVERCSVLWGASHCRNSHRFRFRWRRWSSRS